MMIPLVIKQLPNFCQFKKVFRHFAISNNIKLLELGAAVSTSSS